MNQIAFIDQPQPSENYSRPNIVLSDIFENSRDVIFTISPNTAFTLLNPAFEIITGWSVDEWLGQLFPPLIHPDDLPRAMKIFTSVMLGRKPDMFDLRIVKKSGDYASIEFTVAPQMVNGKAIAVVGVGRDVTERKHMEAALRESQGRWRSIAQSAPDTIMTLDDDGMILFINRQLPGKESLRFVGTTIFQHVSPDYHATLKASLERVLLLGETVNCEVAGGAEDSLSGWHSVRMGPIRNDDAIVAATSIFTDITERKKAEADMLEWKNRYEAAVQASGHVLYDWNPTKNEITYGGNVHKTLGFSAEDLNGAFSKSLDLIHPEDRMSIEQEMQRAVIGKYPLHVEYRVRKKSGRYCIVRNDGYFVLDAVGNIARIVGFIVDISSQRALEEQLRHSQKMEAFGRLAGGVAHDFNNLLTVISGYNDLVLHGLSQNDPRRECVVEVGKAAERAASLTAQLLAFSRQQVLQPKVFDLNSVLTDVSKMLRRLIGEDIHLETIPADEPASVKADLGQLENVLVNLAVNARDAMPNGGKLTITTQNVVLDGSSPEVAEGMNPGKHVLIAVTDTGSGMSEDVQANIFEPFFTTKAVGRGTGLGLATCYGIVKQSGGHIGVESELGVGTTFKIHLPRVDEERVTEFTATDFDQACGGSETILVVEDEPMVRKLTVSVLAGLGYRILEACNGEEAFRIAQMNTGERLDLVITDIVMPEMSGNDLAHWIRAAHPTAKILFTSGYPNHALDQDGGLGTEANFLPKPFAPKLLAQTVRELLNQKS